MVGVADTHRVLEWRNRLGDLPRKVGEELDQVGRGSWQARKLELDREIIALEDDIRIRRALKVTQGIDFYRYQVSFKLTKEAI